MSNLAVIFPGQGSQSVGMLKDLSEKHPLIIDIFKHASSILGYDLWSLVSDGPAEQLNQTQYTQPALLVADYAVWKCYESLTDVRPTYLAGHSLGEYSALLCADVLSFEDALDLVKTRAIAMSDAVPSGTGAMAAIIGLSDDAVLNLCQEVAHNEVLSPVNYNSISQVVIAGHKTAVMRAVDSAKSHGAKLAKLLPVSVPSHCQLMSPALESLNECMQSKKWNNPKIPVIQNFDVLSHSSIFDMQHSLLQQLISPVRWVATIEAMSQLGVTHLIECGPGKVLAGLIKRINNQLIVSTTQTNDELVSAINLCKEFQV